jgi:hypothetical protein
MRCDARDPPTLSNPPTNQRRGGDGSVGGAERGVVWGSIEGGGLVNLRQLPAVPVMQRLRPDGTTGWKLQTYVWTSMEQMGMLREGSIYIFARSGRRTGGHLHYLLRKLEAGKRTWRPPPLLGGRVLRMEPK